MRAARTFLVFVLAVLATACRTQPEDMTSPSNAPLGTDPIVRLMVLDPGHFHAALVQKAMVPGVDTRVHVYAPDGPEVQDYLRRVEGFNTREENPTAWEEVVYLGDDYLERMLADRPGNVMVIAGNNRRKTEAILRAVEAGIHVLADKPMVISAEAYPDLERAFSVAQSQGLLLYDIMTERYEITSEVQRALMQAREVFGELQVGTPQEPAISMRSVHHFFKDVAGVPIVRPAWFFDPDQEGEAIVDVGTHLVDLASWMAFPDETLQVSDVEVLAARRWPTPMTRDEFERVTGVAEFPPFLREDVEDGALQVYQNNEVTYRLRGIHVRLAAEWKYEAREGGDTHDAVVRGSKARLVIRQGAEEGWIPQVYVEVEDGIASGRFESALRGVLNALPFSGIGMSRVRPGVWRIDIPESYRVGHEAHFSQVTERFLSYLASGELPEWEVPNMLVKYWITTRALDLAKRGRG